MWQLTRRFRGLPALNYLVLWHLDHIKAKIDEQRARLLGHDLPGNLLAILENQDLLVGGLTD